LKASKALQPKSESLTQMDVWDGTTGPASKLLNLTFPSGPNGPSITNGTASKSPANRTGKKSSAKKKSVVNSKSLASALSKDKFK